MARAGARLSEPGADPGDQLGERERLREVVGGPELQASDLRLDVGERREDEDALIGATLQQIPKDGDFPLGMRSSDLGQLIQSEAYDAKASPAHSRSLEDFGFGRLLFSDGAECVCNTCRAAP